MRTKKSNSFLKSKPFGFVKVLTISLVSLSLFTRCYVPSEYLDSDLVPDSERLAVKTDTTFILSAHTLTYDSVDTRFFDQIVLGAVNDKVFGSYKSSFMSDIRIGTAGFVFKTAYVLDSALLSLKLNDFYGDKSTQITVTLYEVSDSLENDHLSNSLLPATNMYYTTPISTVNYNGESTLKFYLNEQFKNKLISADSATMSTQNKFMSYIRGLYITTNELSSDSKVMYYFNFLSTENKLTLYYRESPVDTVTKTFNYLFSSNSVRSLRFEHDRSTAFPATAILNLNDTTTQDSVFYLQGLGGAKGLIKLEGLSDWAAKMPVVINRAELRIEPEQVPFFVSDSVFTEINIYKKNSANQYGAITDLQYYSGTFGGTYIKYKGYYSFNITNHLQEQLQSSTPDFNIYLEPRYRFSRASQTILKTANNSQKIKLIITYTKL